MGYFLEAFCPGFNTISDSKAPKRIRAPFRQLYENEYANKTHFCGVKNFFFRPRPVWKGWRKGQNGPLRTVVLF